MSDQPSALDSPAALLEKRFAYLAGVLATNTALRTLVLNRLMYLVTRYDIPFDQEQFDSLVSRYRPTELDIAILRAVADALESLETECPTRSEGGV